MHFYAVNIDGTNEIDLTPFENIQARIIDDLEDDQNHVIIGLNKRNAQIHDPYRVNINDGTMEMIAENPGNISGWGTDHNGKLRIATTSDGVNTSLLYREKESDDFKPILTTDFKVSVAPLFLLLIIKIFMLHQIERDKTAIFEFDLKEAKEGKLIFEHDEVDVSGLMYSKKRKVLTGVNYTVAKRNIKFFDPWEEDIQEKLKKNYLVTK